MPTDTASFWFIVYPAHHRQIYCRRVGGIPCVAGYTDEIAALRAANQYGIAAADGSVVLLELPAAELQGWLARFRGSDVAHVSWDGAAPQPIDAAPTTSPHSPTPSDLSTLANAIAEGHRRWMAKEDVEADGCHPLTSAGFAVMHELFTAPDDLHEARLLASARAAAAIVISCPAECRWEAWAASPADQTLSQWAERIVALGPTHPPIAAE